MSSVRSVLRSSLFSLSLIGLLPGIARSQCLEFTPGLGPPGDGLGGSALAQVVFDDGTGPALFVAGDFATAGDTPANNIAKWDGTTWSALRGGTADGVESLAVFDDGTGPALYVGGHFLSVDGIPASNIARWNGTTWSAVGAGLGADVAALASFDDGSGPALYAGGYFGTHLARWNGSTWSTTFGTADYPVSVLKVLDDGTGPALFAGGLFEHVGGIPANSVAKWNGVTWSALGSGVTGAIYDLAAYDDGSGLAIYAGGSPTHAGGLPVSGIARWNGSTWSALGSGTGPAFRYIVRSLAVYGGLGAQVLYVGGDFTLAGGAPASHIATWDGSTWSALGSGTQDAVSTMTVFDAGAGPVLYVGGDFATAGSLAASALAEWNGASWSGLDSAAHDGIPGFVRSLATFDDGSGQALYAGGDFFDAGGSPASGIARWSGASWSALASGVSGVNFDSVYALAVHDDGSGPALFVGGRFDSAGGIAAPNIARWDGHAWSALGAGTSGLVKALAVFDDGSGPKLYAGGSFTTAGGSPAAGIARWDGVSWAPLGSGVNTVVDALVVYDDGSGPALYVGGGFTTAGGSTAQRVARWDGTSWSTLGCGVGYAQANDHAFALSVFDLGAGPELIVGGRFSFAGCADAANVARWNGSTWSVMGNLPPTHALTSFDDGSGPGLYAACELPGGIKRWNGSSWSTLEGGLDGNGLALAAFDDPASGRPDLFVGGHFQLADGLSSLDIAQWRGCTGPGTRFCFGDGSSAACPCGNSGTNEHGCQNSASTGGSLLTAAGQVSPDSVVLTASGELPSALSIFLQGTTSLGPVSYGDGLRCAGGTLKRLYAKSASGGLVAAPQAGDPSITSRSAALGDPIAPGATRIYQVYYRDPNPGFCPPPSGSTFNVSNGVRIVW
jgi:hypothetical protein